MHEDEVIKYIADALKEKNGHDIADIFNDICIKQIKYVGDGFFEELEEGEEIPE